MKRGIYASLEIWQGNDKNMRKFISYHLSRHFVGALDWYLREINLFDANIIMKRRYDLL